MKKFLGSYGIPIIETTATLALAVLTLTISFWLRAATIPPDSETPAPSIMHVLLENCINFTTPVPYYAICLVVALIGRIDGFKNRYKLGELDALNERLVGSDHERRTEAQAHAESKSNYLETLGSALKYLLTSSSTGFDHRCRVTIYRRQRENDDYLGSGLITRTAQ